jgi:hypothetical protein
MDVLYLWTFCRLDVLYPWTFCIYGRFVGRMFCRERHYVEGRFVDGRFVEGRFVVVPFILFISGFKFILVLLLRQLF